jgi:cation diffusion facilitator family transporter
MTMLPNPAPLVQDARMADSSSIKDNIVLYAALAANLGIGVAKFVAAGITGSSSMLTEGFHSVVDSLNQVLLLYGQRRAKRPADQAHPFGYGRELYFWAFVVAILIFAIGAGISIYEGWRHIQHPEPLSSPTINYVVLAISILLEGSSWTLAVREFAASKGKEGWWRAIRRSKDPAGFIVLFEDSAALAGLAIAGIGIWASHAFDDPRIDGVASILIGLILGLVAILLARDAPGDRLGQSCPHDPHRTREHLRGDQCRLPRRNHDGRGRDYDRGDGNAAARRGSDARLYLYPPGEARRRHADRRTRGSRSVSRPRDEDDVTSNADGSSPFNSLAVPPMLR